MFNPIRRFVLVLVLSFALGPVAGFAQEGGVLSDPGAAKSGAGEAPVIAAAASLRIALGQVARAFTAETGQAVTVTYGATGNLVRQVEEGAPFQVFLAADEASVARLKQNGKTDGDSAILVEGRLAIVVPHASAIEVDPGLEGLKAALGSGQIKHLSIANPELAPYGKAAQEALTRVGLWDGVRPLLVQGENIGQAAQYVTTGAAEAGLVAQSLLIAPEVAAKVKQVAVDPALYKPIKQGMTVLKGAGDVAKAFYAYLKTEAATAIFERNGFNVPKG